MKSGGKSYKCKDLDAWHISTPLADAMAWMLVREIGSFLVCIESTVIVKEYGLKL